MRGHRSALAPRRARRGSATDHAVTTHAHRVHKIDSTLRGNWSAELAALVDAGRRVVLIPSHPLAGRVCAGGVVYVNGVPVADSELGNDPRLPVRSSRPSEALPGAELAGRRSLAEWLARSRPGVAIVDASSLARSTSWSPSRSIADDVVVSGRPRWFEAVARHLVAARRGHAFPPVAADADRRGVRQPASRQPRPDRQGVPKPASRWSRRRRSVRPIPKWSQPRLPSVPTISSLTSGARSVMLIGGDTAEAFIGDSVVRVFGSIDVGVSLGDADIRGTRLRIASKPGGFGTPNTLVDLVTR